MTSVDALPDLTLPQCCDRWGVSSRNAIKARARAIGVELRIESSTCTVWPGEHVALGDQLNDYLRNRGKLADFPHKLPSAGDGTDTRRDAALTAPAAGTDALAALAAMVAAMRPEPAADPLAVSRGLAEAADAGHWLSTGELAQLLGVHRSTVGHWPDRHCPRPGYRLERRKDGAAVWWQVTRQ